STSPTATSPRSTASPTTACSRSTTSPCRGGPGLPRRPFSRRDRGTWHCPVPTGGEGPPTSRRVRLEEKDGGERVQSDGDDAQPPVRIDGQEPSQEAVARVPDGHASARGRWRRRKGIGNRQEGHSPVLDGVREELHRGAGIREQ